MTNKFTPHFLPEGGSYVKQIATMEKPVIPLVSNYIMIGTEMSPQSKRQYDSDMYHYASNLEIYIVHLSELLQYPMPSMSEEFGKRGEVMLDVDFRLQKTGEPTCTPFGELWDFVAIPLPAPEVEDSVNRPKLTDYLSVEKFDLKDVVTIYESQPELFNYAKALDLYIDHLASTTPQQESKERSMINLVYSMLEEMETFEPDNFKNIHPGMKQFYDWAKDYLAGQESKGEQEIPAGTTKPFIVANVREIFDNEETTYSRKVELLNEVAASYYKSSPVSDAVGFAEFIASKAVDHEQNGTVHILNDGIRYTTVELYNLYRQSHPNSNEGQEELWADALAETGIVSERISNSDWNGAIKELQSKYLITKK